jgi:hypothetical protein
MSLFVQVKAVAPEPTADGPASTEIGDQPLSKKALKKIAKVRHSTLQCCSYTTPIFTNVFVFTFDCLTGRPCCQGDQGEGPKQVGTQTRGR